jgi:septum formation protein
MAEACSLVLASASPRRREILTTLGIEVEVMPTDADEESVQLSDHVSFAREAARLKLRSALARKELGGRFVLSADTIVCVDDERLGKPRDEDEAVEMLRRLSGRDHLVRTAVALGRGGAGELDCRVVETRVWFRALDAQALRRYVHRGESLDKAGAYGVQGAAAGFVRRLDGSYSNVVGLPAAEVVELLVHHGVIERWP